ncbi:MAG: hypothetical protein QRY74_04490 [Chlamydia sp.]
MILLLLLLPLFEWFFVYYSASIFIPSPASKRAPIFLLSFAISSIALLEFYHIHSEIAPDQFCLGFDVENSIDASDRAALTAKIANKILPCATGLGLFSIKERDSLFSLIVAPTVNPLFLELVAGEALSKKLTGTSDEPNSSFIYIFITENFIPKELLKKKYPHFISCQMPSLQIISSSETSIEGEPLLYAVNSISKTVLKEMQRAKRSVPNRLQILPIFFVLIALLSLLGWMKEKQIGKIFMLLFSLFFPIDYSLWASEKDISKSFSPEMINQQFIEAEVMLKKSSEEAILSIESILPYIENQKARQRALLSESYAYIIADDFSTSLQVLMSALSTKQPLDRECFFYISSIVRMAHKNSKYLSPSDQAALLKIVSSILDEQVRISPLPTDIRSECFFLREILFQEQARVQWNSDISWPFFWLDVEIDEVSSEARKEALTGPFFRQQILQIAPIVQKEADRIQIPAIPEKMKKILSKNSNNPSLDVYEMLLTTLWIQDIRKNSPSSYLETLDQLIITTFAEAIRMSRLMEFFPQRAAILQEKKRVTHSWILFFIENGIQEKALSEREKKALNTFKRIALSQERKWNSSEALFQTLSLWKIAMNGLNLPFFQVEERLPSSAYDSIEPIVAQLSEMSLAKEPQIYDPEEVRQFLPFKTEIHPSSFEKLLFSSLSKWIDFSPIEGSSWLVALQNEHSGLFKEEKTILNRALFSYMNIVQKMDQTKESSLGESLLATRALQALFFAQFISWSDIDQKIATSSIESLRTLIPLYEKSLLKSVQHRDPKNRSAIQSLLKRVDNLLDSGSVSTEVLQELGRNTYLISEILLSKETRPSSSFTKEEKNGPYKEPVLQIEDAIRMYQEMDLRDRELLQSE